MHPFLVGMGRWEYGCSSGPSSRITAAEGGHDDGMDCAHFSVRVRRIADEPIASW